jgi:hypothetical protein
MMSFLPEYSASRRSFLLTGVAAAAPPAAEDIADLRSEKLRDSLRLACRWVTDVAQMRSDTLGEERNSRKLMHRHWKGALRGEYSAARRQWSFFCPIWHTGQAIKALVWAGQALHEESLIAAAKFSAGFIGAERVSSQDDPDYGLIFGFEDKGGEVNTSAVLECLDGLFVLSDATREGRYAEWALAAVAWVARKAWLGDGLFRDAYDVQSRQFMPPPWGGDKPGRPLMENAIFLKAWRRTQNPRYRTIFYTVADRLLKDEEPAGNWINYPPCNPRNGNIHPRQAFWWGYPMLDAYRDSRDRKYLACAARAGEWYLNAMRADGGLFRGTFRDFRTDSFGHATSGIACAALLWHELWKETGESRWLAAIQKALNHCMKMQFREVQDPNLAGAILEKVQPPDGTDRSPYHLRDLGTIFYIQAASSVLRP